MRTIFPLSLSLLLLTSCGGGGGDSYNPSTGHVSTRPPWAFDAESRYCSFDTREAFTLTIEAGNPACEVVFIGNSLDDEPWPGCSWPSSPDVSVCRHNLAAAREAYEDGTLHVLDIVQHLGALYNADSEPDFGPDDEESE